MWPKLSLVLAIFILASNCGGLPIETPDGALNSDDLPKDEYSDVIRLLNSSAIADSEGPAKLAHAAKVGPHGEHKHPAVPADADGAPKSAKKLSKTSPVKKYKSRKSKAKHSSKSAVKSGPLDSQILNDSPSSDRVKEVLSRRRISSKRTAAAVAKQLETSKIELPVSTAQPYTQPLYYNPYQYQPSYYNYHQQPSYPAFYNDYSYPSINPFAALQYSSYPDFNNWDNNLQADNIPSEPVVTMSKVEPPEMTWDAEIEFPNMPPIVINSKNYTNNPHTEVNIVTAPDESAQKPTVEHAKTVWSPPQVTSGSPRTASFNPSFNPSPPLIWSNGMPYVPLTSILQSRFLDSPNPLANPYTFVTPPVYYRPPSNLPYTQNTPVQTWLPSSQPYHSTWPLSPSPQPNVNVYQSQGQNHEVNVFPASNSEVRDTSVEEGSVRTSVFHGSKEVTGEKLEINIIPADPNAAEVDDSAEVKPAAAATVVVENDDDD